MSKKSSDKVLSELLSNQLKKVDIAKKLDYSDIRRLTKYIDKSIFNSSECVLWKGYVTNLNNKSKGTYINFFFKQKKYALHRLLYINYIGPLYDEEYLKFNCENKGCCCNINHIQKFDKSDAPKTKIEQKTNIQNEDPKIIKEQIINTESDINFIVDFE
jgi:hypothetical protein